MIDKKKVIIFAKLPPPLTGATMMNQFVFNSKLLDDHFTIERLGVSYASSVADLGHKSIKKVLKYCWTFLRFANKLLFKRPQFIYFQPSVLGVAFFRDIIFIAFGRMVGLKFLLHLHGKGIAEAAEKSNIKAFLYKLGFRSQFIIVLSEKQKEDINFTKPQKIYVIANGILDVLPSTVIDDKLDDSSVFRFLFLSNLFTNKGVYDLMEATTLLKEKNKDKRFVIDVVGGEGDIKLVELKLLMRDKGLESNVFVHGAKYNEEKIEFLTNANALVFPTLNEAFGLVIIEAMQFSLPVIASNEGAIPDIISDGKTGFIIEKSDIEALADKMQFLMNNPDIAREMGCAGRQVFEERFTLECFERNMKNTFNDVLLSLEK